MNKYSQYFYYCNGNWIETNRDEIQTRIEINQKTFVRLHMEDRTGICALAKYYEESMKINEKILDICDSRNICDSRIELKIPYKSGKIKFVFLFNFPDIITKETIFEYIQKYPKYLPEIVFLAHHFSWLNEKELLLLSTIALLK